MRISSKTILRIVIYSAILTSIPMYLWGRSLWYPIYLKVRGRETCASIYTKIGQNAEASLRKSFAAKNLQYPPQKLSLIAIKDERKLELWVGSNLIKSYPFTGFSGTLGPKLRSGDRQIPEGLYKIEYLNPNSSYHLSMKISYPNAIDKKGAQSENRQNLGGDIFIHGKSATIGCIPIGDKNIEELFIIAYQVGFKNIDVIIAPTDFRKPKANFALPRKDWLREKYARTKKALLSFKEENKAH